MGGERYPEDVRIEAGEQLLHVAGRDVVLRRELDERAVRLQRLERRRELRPDRVALAVVDAEPVRLREEVADGDLPGMRAHRGGGRGVLAEDGVGAADQDLTDRVGVTGVAAEGEAELLLQPLEIRLVLR